MNSYNANVLLAGRNVIVARLATLVVKAFFLLIAGRSNAFSGALYTIPSEVRVKRSLVPVDSWVEAALVAGCVFWMGMREGLFLPRCVACGQLGVRPG